LNCRACEAVCPSGVQYGVILEASRAQLERARLNGTIKLAEEASSALPDSTRNMQHTTLSRRPLWQRALRGAVFGALFKDMRLFRTFSGSMALYQKSGAQWLARRSGALKLIGMAETETLLPALSDEVIVPQGQIYPSAGTYRHSVALLTGCIMSTAFSEVHQATIRVLQKNGCEVILPPDQGCCGALHTHGGDLDGGRELARRNIAAFEGLGVDAIIVNAAGCGSTMKEYAHLLHDDPTWYERAKAFVAKVKDVHEFLAGIELNTADLGRLELCVTYQEPCHLAHAQRITAQPRSLLRAIPGLELREMPESSLCCGSAGIYNVTQPEMAAALGDRKVRNALTTGAHVIATANPGCALQIANELRRRGAEVQVRYIVELLDAAYAAQ
ncbi:MAG: 4Fe-4S ferredoxin, partial [Oscillochloris sp.]|nr:4Fe-4S ferredoxin [Oscillochloris sp.]